MIDLTSLIIAILTFIISAISVYLIPYLKQKINVEKLDIIKFWINIAVEAAEQIYNGIGRGKEKKEYVLKFLNQKGFKLDIDAIDNMIESSVLNLKKNIKTSNKD